MKVLRRMETETNTPEVGDIIELKNGYTATCQKITEAGALMLLDQYVAERPMNEEHSNRGGWEDCDLRTFLLNNLDEFIPDDLFRSLGDFENGDNVRIPMLGEMVDEVPDWAEYQNAEQWPLMKDRRNRIAFHQDGRWDWCWCMDKDTDSATDFCIVGYDGGAGNGGASNSGGVRPAFLIIQ
nr:MAG TPA: hypothetical protein [Caudoviricetes sp.]